MKFNISLVMLFSFLCNTLGFSQERDSTQIKHEIFFKKVCEKGGVWVGANPKYDANKPEDFSVFILKFEQKDPLSIDAEILGVNTKNDTIGFWKFSEFYTIDKKKNIYYQRSWDGQYYATGFATMTETERQCAMSFYYLGDEYLKHKDTHTLTDSNTMTSVSYDYDSKSGEWTNKTEMVWKRQL